MTVGFIDLYHLTGDQEKENSLRQQSATTADEIKNGEGLGNRLLKW